MLLDLINDILDITVIESGQLKISKRFVPLNDIVGEIAQNFSEKIIKAQHKNVKFNIVNNLSGDDLQIYTDALRLKQVIINLVKNALKFTHDGEIKLSFSFADDNRYLLITVEDTGIGIRPENQADIFNRFAKFGDTANHQYNGTGLGLTISKEIVEMLDGQIWFESIFSKGSKFWFTLKISGQEEKLPV
jgi:signal transduction histidine kinase